MVQNIKKNVITLIFMGVISIGMLLGLSILTYVFQWKAKEALIGITFIYIMTGFLGGNIKKRMSDEIKMGKKLIEGLLLGTLYVCFLWILSFFLLDTDGAIGSRFYLIWLLIAGSTALGRIL